MSEITYAKEDETVSAERFNELLTTFQITELEANSTADELVKLRAENASLKINGDIKLEPAVRAMFDSFMDDANARREKNNQRRVRDVCYWASDLVNRGITGMRNQWKSADKYVAKETLLAELKAAKLAGDVDKVTALLDELVSMK